MNTITLNWEISEDDTEDEDLERTAIFPAKKELCTECKGYGHVLNPSMRDHAYTSEEMRNDFSESEREQYFKHGGIYDVLCPTCKGANVIDVVDTDALNATQHKLFQQYLASLERREEINRLIESESRMERMLGC